MGALAEGFAAYVQPLIDQTDGSIEQLKKAFAIGQLCYNLALLPDDSREKMLSESRQSLHMDEEEFETFQRTIVIPMIRRHQEMFPQLHRRISTASMQSGPSSRAQPGINALGEIYPGTAPYAPCPCESGRKYKFCCRSKRR